MYEALSARREGRQPTDLYHSALEVYENGHRSVIEMTPVCGNGSFPRGVVCEGPVGSVWLGRSRIFRYEIRRWRGGVIADVDQAVGGPRSLPTDPRRVRQLLDLVPAFPTHTWGRDELDVGDMWNSNSLVSWLLASSGHRVEDIRPPADGRAPGWHAGVTAAACSRLAGSEADDALRALDLVGATGIEPATTRL